MTAGDGGRRALFPATPLVIASMLGTGVFTSSGFLPSAVVRQPVAISRRLPTLAATGAA